MSVRSVGLSDGLSVLSVLWQNGRVHTDAVGMVSVWFDLCLDAVRPRVLCMLSCI